MSVKQYETTNIIFWNETPTMQIIIRLATLAAPAAARANWMMFDALPRALQTLRDALLLTGSCLVRHLLFRPML